PRTAALLPYPTLFRSPALAGAHAATRHQFRLAQVGIAGQRRQADVLAAADQGVGRGQPAQRIIEGEAAGQGIGESARARASWQRSEEHTSELQSRENL